MKSQDNTKMGNIHVGPLLPIIRADVPAGLARELLELASWFATVYCRNTVGLGDPWSMIVRWLTDSLTLASSDSPGIRHTYTIPLPSSLDKDCAAVP
jgi:hypothetical protein